MHKICSGIKGSKIKVSKSTVCRGCTDQPDSMYTTSMNISDGANLELCSVTWVTCCVDGDADAAVEARVHEGWNKLRQLVPLLTSKDITLLIRAKITC